MLLLTAKYRHDRISWQASNWRSSRVIYIIISYIYALVFWPGAENVDDEYNASSHDGILSVSECHGLFAGLMTFHADIRVEGDTDTIT